MTKRALYFAFLGAAVGACASSEQDQAATEALRFEAEGVRADLEWCRRGGPETAECLFAIESPSGRRANLSSVRLFGTGDRSVLMATSALQGVPQQFQARAVSLPPDFGEIVRITAALGAAHTESFSGIYRNVEFTDIPSAPASAVAAETTVDAPEPETVELADTFWRGVITPIGGEPQPPVVLRWRRGGYLHFRSDGAVGHNWVRPEDYVYSPGDIWMNDGGDFRLDLSGSSFSFGSPHFGAGGHASWSARPNAGGAYQMTLTPSKLR